MESGLNELELYLLENIINSNEKYDVLKEQLVSLKVESRKYTGVGAYINFNLESGSIAGSSKTHLRQSAILGCPKLLLIDDVKSPLSFELNISNGRIDFLELVINGDEYWDGSYTNFILIDLK